MPATGVAVPNQAAPSNASVIAVDTVNVVSTTLASAAAAGATSLALTSAAGLSAGSIITLADASAEIVEIASISANTVALVTATRSAHASGAVVVLAFAQQVVSIGDPTQPGLRGGLDPNGNLKVVVIGSTQATSSVSWSSANGWSSTPPTAGVLYGVVISSPGTATVRLTDGSGGLPLWIYSANEGAGDADPMPPKVWANGLNWSATSTGLVVTLFYGPSSAAIQSQLIQIVPTSSNTVVPNRTGNGVLYGVLVAASGTAAVRLFDGSGTTIHIVAASTGVGDDTVNTPKPYFGGLYYVGAASGNPTLVLTST